MIIQKVNYYKRKILKNFSLEIECFRISNELLKNESIFLSDYLSNKYLKSDVNKNIKIYIFSKKTYYI